MKRLAAVLLIFVMTFGLFGCSISATRKEVMGLSVDDVANAKKKFSKVVAIDPVTCVEKTAGIVTITMKAQLTGSLVNDSTDSFWLRAIKFDKFYPTCIDTTQVAILIKKKGRDKSRVEVFSDNIFLAEAVSSKLFELLEQKP